MKEQSKLESFEAKTVQKNSHMFIQITFVRKRLLTHGTAKGFFSSVNSHMVIQISFVSKWLLTHGTTKGFLPSVNSHVCSQSTTFSK